MNAALIAASYVDSFFYFSSLSMQTSNEYTYSSPPLDIGMDNFSFLPFFVVEEL